MLQSLPQLRSSELPLSEKRNVSVLLEDQAHLSLLPKASYVELVIPIELYNSSLLNCSANRIIILFSEESQLVKLGEVFSDFVLNKRYPLTKGIPLCHSMIQHTIEIFQKIESEKPEECTGCVLQKYCFLNGKFKPKPILEADKDLLRFLE